LGDSVSGGPSAEVRLSMGTTQSLPSGAAYDALTGERSEDPFALVICGPSGVGKGTLIKWLMETWPDKYGFSVSHTTRSPRPGEQDGVHYHFIKREDMLESIDLGLFLEHAHVHGNIYGTSIDAVKKVASMGRCCVLDIDVQGARQVRKSGLDAIFVFIAPPSEEELVTRLKGRGTDTEESIAVRVANAKQEMESIQEPGLFDFLIVNEDLDSAKQQLERVGGLALAGQDPAELLAGQEGDGQGDYQVYDNGVEQESSLDLQENSHDNEDVHERASINQKTEPPAEQTEVAEPEMAAVSLKDGPVENGVEAVEEDGPAEQEQEQQPGGLAAWADKVAVVTGASSGSGWAMVMELLHGGLKVVAIARRRERLEHLQSEVLSSGVNPVDFLPIVCDITKEAEVLALPRIIAKRWPGSGIDILINNAGVGRPNASLIDGSTGSWVQMISTNVIGLSLCSREAVQDMIQRNAMGHIINIGHHPDASAGTAEAFYAATKATVRALTAGLRAEVNEKKLPIRVSLISPSAVNSEFYHAGEESNGAISKSPKLQPQDVAAAVLWCLSAPASVDISEVALRPTAGR